MLNKIYNAYEINKNHDKKKNQFKIIIINQPRKSEKTCENVSARTNYESIVYFRLKRTVMKIQQGCESSTQILILMSSLDSMAEMYAV